MHNAGLRTFFYKGLSFLTALFFFSQTYVDCQASRNTSIPTITFPSVVIATSLDATTSENSTANGTLCNDSPGASLANGGPQEVVVIILILVSLGTVFGNLLVLAAVLIFHELQTITNMFVGSLACADLIMGAFVMPIGIPYAITGKWGLGTLFCDIWISIDVLMVTASIETLCAIALDRYLAITKPFTYTASVTRSRARCFIVLIWITSASIAFIPVQLGWWKDDSFEAQCCYNDPECCEFITNKTYAALSSSLSFYVPLIIMIFSYAIVFKEAIRLASQIDSQTGYIRRASMPGTNRPLWTRQQRRTVFTFGLIMGIFAVSWLPFFIVNLAQAFCKGCVPSSVFTTLNWIGYANSFFNPFIYCHNAQFRQAFVRLLTCLPCSEGFERTKRASLSDSFPRYRDSSRESTLHMLTTFFLSGGSSRKKSTRRSATSSTIVFKRDSSMSRSSPTRSPTRLPRFRLGSDDFVMCKTDNNNDFSSMLDYKRDTDSFHASEVSSSSLKSKRNSVVCFADESLVPNGKRGPCSCSGLHRCCDCDTATTPLLNVSSTTENDPLSLLQCSPRYSLADTTCYNNGNGNVEPPPRICKGTRQIRTRRSKSLYVTAHNVEVFNGLRNSTNQTTNSSCYNLRHGDEVSAIVESDDHVTAGSPVMLGEIHVVTLDPYTPQISPRTKH